MSAKPTRGELLAKMADGSFLDYARSVMDDFCFTIDLHQGEDRIWFGSHTLTVNRNVAFNFFDRDVSKDEGLEPFPVVRAERSETMEVRVRPFPDDPSSDYVVPVFHLEKDAYDRAIASMDRILADYEGIRTIPDVFFADEPVIALVRDRLLKHPPVAAERSADWPSFLQ
ncbi:MAG: hypothetical protein HY716_09360 [Planctomycetes bacterium]|nr:hypothetical protein [Planctomycetota bacterium]